MASRLTKCHCPSLWRPMSTATTTVAAASSPPHHRDSQTFTLPSGRVLGFAEYGSSTGAPVLYFHGYPSSRLEGYALGPIGRRRGLRIISLDRPGFGLSSPLPGRQIMDYPDDVRTLARHLGLEHFAVLGASGGGPYALACAKQLPSNMLSAVGLLASAGPWEAGLGNQSWWRKMTAWGIEYVPWLVQRVLEIAVAATQWISRTSFATKRLDAWLASVNEQERKEQTAAAANPEASTQDAKEDHQTIQDQREQLLRTLFDGFSQGAAAAVEEGRLLTRPWGIRFEDIEYDKIQIWHGAGDNQSPVQNIRWMAEKIPHAKLKELEDDGHFSMGNQLADVLRDLDSEARKDTASAGEKRA